MVSEHEWLFVGGMMRTGTTLMARLLTLHPEGFVTAECGWPLTTYWSFAAPPAGYGYAEFGGWRGDSSIRVQWPAKRIEQYDDPASVTRAMCDGYVSRLHPEVRVCGDKWPNFGALHADGSGRRVWEDLRVVWPDCKLLWMDRDFEAAIESACRTWPHGDEATFRAQAKERRIGQRLCEDAYWVRLEALNANPREVIEGVLEFANLPAETYPWETFDQHFREGHRVN
jgi:hypothetical protein